MGGQAKGLLEVGGRRMIDRVAEALREATDRLVLSSNDAAAPAWLDDVDVVPDATPGRGPLAGVAAALTSVQSDVLVLGWDTPFVPGALLRALRDEGARGDALIVAPKSASPWGWEPLCAWYSHGALPAISAQLDAGDARLGALAGPAKLRILDVMSWGNPTELFFNVNTPEDLERAGAMAARIP
jgi:molybdopterin-guanine dinucleotide biosynthesis protein A